MTATVTITDVKPTVTLDKSVDVKFLDEPGGDFTFTLLITNNSTEEVTITSLTDTNTLSQDCLDLIGTKLAAGACASCTYVVSHTDVGGWENTAEVVVTDNDGSTGTDSDTQFVSVGDVRPSVTLEKLVDITTLPEPGGDFHFTLKITNTSVEPVLITQFTDDNLPTEWFPEYVGIKWLAPGEVLEIPYTVAHTDAMTYGNIASVTVEDNEGTPVTADATQLVEVTDVLPTVTLVKTASPSTLPEPGGVFAFTLTITNNSVEDVIISELTDTQMSESQDFWACEGLISYDFYTDPIPAGESVSCTYTVEHLDAGSYDNTASVTVVDNEFNQAADSDTQTVTVTNVLPTIAVDKSANPTSLPEPGGNVEFTVVVTNNSFEAVTLTSLTDNVYGDLNGQGTCATGGTIAASASYSCKFTGAVNGGPGSYTDTVTAVATDNDGTTDTKSDDATVTLTNVLPTIAVDKTANPTSLPEPGGNVEFTVVVTNISFEPVTLTSLTDDVYGSLDGQGTCAKGGTIAAGGSYTCKFTGAVSGEPSAYTDTVTAVATDNDGTTDTQTDTATVTITDVKPTVTLDKSVDVEFLDEPGGDFTFTLLITNNSTEEVTITALTDSQSGDAVDFSACAALIGTKLAAGASTSCTYVVTHTDVALAAAATTTPPTVTVTDNDGSTGQR